jgi:hypothetical protein
MARDPTQPKATGSTSAALKKLAEREKAQRPFIRVLDQVPDWRLPGKSSRTSLFISDVEEFHATSRDEQLEAWIEHELEVIEDDLTLEKLTEGFEDLTKKLDQTYGSHIHVVGAGEDQTLITAVLNPETKDSTEKLLRVAAIQKEAAEDALRFVIDIGRQTALDRGEVMHGLQLLQAEVVRLRAIPVPEEEAAGEPEELVCARQVVRELKEKVAELQSHIAELSMRSRGVTENTTTTTTGLAAPRTHGKSSRFPDPDPLSDGTEPSVEDWEQALRMKLRANQDHFADEYAKMAYAMSRLREPALGLVKHRVVEVEDEEDELDDDAILSVEDLLAVLHEALDDPDQEEKAEEKLALLEMKRTPFNLFRVEFCTLARKSNLPASKWKKALHRRLPYHLRLAMTAMSVDRSVTFTAFCTAAAHMSYQIDTSFAQKSGPESKRSDKEKTKAKASGGAAVPPSTMRTFTPATGGRMKLTPEDRRKLMEEGKCFKCRKQGHVSASCPDKVRETTAPAVAKVVVEEPPQKEPGFVDSDSDSEN